MKTMNKILSEKFDKDEIGQAVSLKIDELKSVLKKVKNPEDWAEKNFYQLMG